MGLKLQIEIDEKLLRRLVVTYLQDVLHAQIEEGDIIIEVKSQQNYKSEWEQASYRARVDKSIP